jgi:hypothetical protein
MGVEGLLQFARFEADVALHGRQAAMIAATLAADR